MTFGVLFYGRRGEPDREHKLQAGANTIGRAADNDIVLADSTVSQYHARLICTPTVCFIEDLGSSNGTVLRNVKLAPGKRQQLKPGDILRVGPYDLRVILPEELKEPPPAVTPASAVTPPSPMEGGPVPPTPAPPPPPTYPRPDAARPTLPGPPGSRTGPPAVRLPGNGPPPIPKDLRLYGGAERVSSYLEYLPPIYHNDLQMGRFLLLFESVLDPIERLIDGIDRYIDPRLAPEGLLPWLASWFGIVIDAGMPVERQRALIDNVAVLFRTRGTRAGLTSYIELATGHTARIVEPAEEHAQGNTRFPAHVFRVILEVDPPAAVDERLLKQVIEAEKPAHTGYILEIVPATRG